MGNPKAGLCPECGVPKRITRQHRWLNNGTIIETKNPKHRMLFFESENIAALFANLEEILNISIEHIVIESQRRSTYDYVVELVPGFAITVLRRIALKPLTKNLLSLGALMGYGKVTLESLTVASKEEGYVTVVVEDPWFLPSYSGLMAGGLEAIMGKEGNVRYEEISPGKFRITAFISTRAMELLDRLHPRIYAPKEGDIALERCGACGGPKALSYYRWVMDRGIIERKTSGRRMVLIGPTEFDVIFEELEKELGEDIPQAIIEAEKRFVTSGFYSKEEITDEAGLREQIALRGMGNLTRFDLDDTGMRIRLENPGMLLVAVGFCRGLFELVSGGVSVAEWKRLEDGDLEIEISPT
jgi:hypothetical protein